MWCMFCMSYVSSRVPLRVGQVEGGVLFGTWWRGGAREFSAEGEGCFFGGFFVLVRGTLRVRVASVGSFAGVGVGVSVRAVVAATSCSLLSISFYVEGKKGS